MEGRLRERGRMEVRRRGEDQKDGIGIIGVSEDEEKG